MAYALGRQLGHWASRTRFVEFFFNTAGGTVAYPAPSAGNYNGVYVLMEKIKANDDRLDIARLDARDTNSVTITGGYSLKIDRNNDADDVNYFSPGSRSSTTFPWITSSDAHELEDIGRKTTGFFMNHATFDELRLTLDSVDNRRIIL